MVRSESGILAIASRRAFSPASREAAALSSLARAFIAAFSSAVKPDAFALVRVEAFFDALPEAVLDAAISSPSQLIGTTNDFRLYTIEATKQVCEYRAMSSATPADPQVTEFAGQLFFRLWRAAHTHTAAAFESIGITTALFSILNFLARGPAIQQEIGTAIGIDPSTMVTLIDELEGAGLAKRRPHAKDRRAREVSLTPKGRRTLERARDFARQVEDDVLRGLGANERRQLMTLLRKALSSAPPQPLWSPDET